MFKSTKQLEGVEIHATDGEIGALHDIYFDDESWLIRYFVVDTAKWLPGRKVLISTDAVHRPWGGDAGLPVDLTREQVKASPDIDTERPVSREAEILLFRHYGWSPYWTDSLAPPPPPMLASTEEEKREAEAIAELTSDRHLQSCRELIGYTLEASDGKAGTVHDFLIDGNGSSIPYLVITSGEWLARKKVMLPAGSITSIKWAEAAIRTSLSRHAVESGSEYEPANA